MKRHSCLSQPFRDSSEAMAALLRPLVILLLADELHGSGTSARQSSALGGETTNKFHKPSRSKVTPMEQETPAQHSEEAEDLDGEGKEDEVRPAHEL